MSDFTKGPWNIDLYGKVKHVICVGPIGYPDGIAQVSTTAPPSQQEANARLISVAPDMYELLSIIANPDHQPEYHSQAMGCGLEDRGITDRYEAMNYGWEKAMDAMAELIGLAEIEGILAKAENKS